MFYQLDHKTPCVPTWSWETLPGEEGFQTIMLVKYLEIFQIYIYILNVSKYILPTFMEQSWQENVASNIMNISYFTNLILRNNTGGGGGVLTIMLVKWKFYVYIYIYSRYFQIFYHLIYFLQWFQETPLHWEQFILPTAEIEPACLCGNLFISATKYH